MNSDPCKLPTLETSPLLKAIDAALRESGQDARGIRVSITAVGEWYEPTGEQERVWVKWLCWNLVSENLADISEPEYCVVHGDLDPIELEKNLKATFPGRTVIVDNDIKMD